MIAVVIINCLVLCLLAVSLVRSPARSVQALRIAFMKGVSLTPWMAVIIVIIGITLSLVRPVTIERYLGGEMTLVQVGIAALAGTISMIPGLVSVPMTASLLEAGASYTTIAAFLTTLIMVGITTLPLELKELGVRITIWRNLLAFFFAIGIAVLIGQVMG